MKLFYNLLVRILLTLGVLNITLLIYIIMKLFKKYLKKNYIKYLKNFFFKG